MAPSITRHDRERWQGQRRQRARRFLRIVCGPGREMMRLHAPGNKVEAKCRNFPPPPKKTGKGRCANNEAVSVTSTFGGHDEPEVIVEGVRVCVRGGHLSCRFYRPRAAPQPGRMSTLTLLKPHECLSRRRAMDSRLAAPVLRGQIFNRETPLGQVISSIYLHCCPFMTPPVPERVDASVRRFTDQCSGCWAKKKKAWFKLLVSGI